MMSLYRLLHLSSAAGTDSWSVRNTWAKCAVLIIGELPSEWAGPIDTRRGLDQCAGNLIKATERVQHFTQPWAASRSGNTAITWLPGLSSEVSVSKDALEGTAKSVWRTWISSNYLLTSVSRAPWTWECVSLYYFVSGGTEACFGKLVLEFSWRCKE